MKIPAFCSYSNLVSLITLPDASGSNYQENQKNIDWLNLIAKSLKVKTNASIEEIQLISSNPFINHLIKKNRITLAGEEINNIENAPETYFSEQKALAIYLLDVDTHHFTEKYGYQFLTITDSAKLITNDYFKMYMSGKKYSWQNIKNVFHPHHSLIVADPYIFNDRNFNAFKTLLYKIIPKKLETSYHLTVIGADRRFTESLPTKNQINTMIENLKKNLLNKLLKPVVEFHVFNRREEFHDRFAITNHIHINSGRGLSIFHDVNNHAQAQYSTYWSGKKPCTLIETEHENSIEFYRVYLENLRLLKKWVLESNNPLSENPLFKLVQ